MGPLTYLFSLYVSCEGVKLIIVCAFWELQQRESEKTLNKNTKGKLGTKLDGLFTGLLTLNIKFIICPYDVKYYRIKLLQMARPDLMLASVT